MLQADALRRAGTDPSSTTTGEVAHALVGRHRRLAKSNGCTLSSAAAPTIKPAASPAHLVVGACIEGHNEVVRAVLILMVLMAWAACLVGVAGLSTYLIVAGVGALRRSRSGVGHVRGRPPTGAVGLLVAYATVMALCAIVLGFLSWQTPVDGGSVLAWAALPTWAALAAVATAAVLRKRRDVPSAPPHP